MAGVAETPKQARLPGGFVAALRLTILLCLLGLAAGNFLLFMRSRGVVLNMFYWLFAEYEVIPLFLVLVFLAVIWVGAWRGWTFGGGWVRRVLNSRTTVWVLAVLTLGIGWAGAHWVYHAYPFSMDEYGAEFQARIFLSGQIFAPVPEEWQPYVKAMTPIFVAYHPGWGWVSQYLPVNSAIRTPFMALGLEWLVNPLLGALTILAVANCARLIWPDRREAGPVAALLLFSSSQFLITNMTAYSFPAHLCFNMWWLYLYLRNTRGSLLLAPWLGVLAMGLHQPLVHPLFVAPFLLRLLYRRRWGWAAYMGLVYPLGVAVWVVWWRAVRPEFDPDAVGSVFGIPGVIQLIQQFLNVALLITWQFPVVLLAFVGLFACSRWPAVVTDLWLSFLLTFTFYLFLMLDQGHGWGYRYAHPVVGNLALLAVVGWQHLSAALREGRAGTVVAVCMLASVAILTPLRLWEVDRTVRPFAQADGYITELEDNVVLIDPTQLWYGQDLIRNDPLFSEGQVRVGVGGRWLKEQQAGRLRAATAAREVTADELLRFGMKRLPPVAPPPPTKAR